MLYIISPVRGSESLPPILNHIDSCVFRPFISILNLTVLSTPKQSNTNILPIHMITPYINGMYVSII